MARIASTMDVLVLGHVVGPGGWSARSWSRTFAVGLAKYDVIAPSLGARSLADYLRTRGMMAA